MSISELYKSSEMYIHLFADCIPVKGASRMAIYDLTRNEIILLPEGYFEMLNYILSDKIGNLLLQLADEEEKTLFTEFVGYLYTNEYITFVEDTSLFPPLQEIWDAPGAIQNAIIDIDTVAHNFDKIFKELSMLGCQFIQIRSFSNLLDIEKLYTILSLSYHTSIQGVELILKFHPEVPDWKYIKLIEDHPIISSLIIHSSLQKKILIVDYGCDDEAGEYIKKEIHFVTPLINSHHHCGIITTSNFCAPAVNTFFENKLYNGCLNRKISVDVLGEIKNCPSMQKSYGNINTVSLHTAINLDGFKNKWLISKDKIDICKNCEFRYVCTDCRAFVEDPANDYSKPLKCGYDPYTAEWQSWSNNPLKQLAKEFYGFRNDVLQDDAFN